LFATLPGIAWLILLFYIKSPSVDAKVNNDPSEGLEVLTVVSQHFFWVLLTLTTWWVAWAYQSTLSAPLGFVGLASVFYAAALLIPLLLVFWFSATKSSKPRWRTCSHQLMQFAASESARGLAIRLGQVLLLQFAVFLGWSFLRKYNPELLSLEKFMDYGFIESIRNYVAVPPIDPFLSGYGINYYYLGHWLSALRSASIYKFPIAAYHFEMSFILSQLFIGVFVLVRYCFRRLRANDISRTSPMNYSAAVVAFLGACFVSFGGNAHLFYHFIKFPSKAYWFPTATRLIPASIHEFPLYSFVVNDLHAHVLAITQNISLITLFLLGAFNVKEVAKSWSKRPLLYSCLWACVQAMIFAYGAASHSWDLPTWGVLLFFLTWITTKSIKHTFLMSLMAAFCSVFLTFPFMETFFPIPKGFAWVSADMRSPLPEWLGVWSLHLIFIVILLSHSRNQIKRLTPSVLIQNPEYLGLSVLVLWGVLLIAIPEIVYVKDIYSSHPRANTMFKFTYLSWMLLGVALSVLLGHYLLSPFERLSSTKKMVVQSTLALVVVAIALAGSFGYTFLAIRSQVVRPQSQMNDINSNTPQSLKFPGEWAIVEYLKSNSLPTDVIAAAAGDSYSTMGIVSVFSGRAPIITWKVHEWLWRGGLSAELSYFCKNKRLPCPDAADTITRRYNDVETIYTSNDCQTVLQTLKRYSVRYIVLGMQEQTKYKADQHRMAAFGMTVAFISNDAILFEVPKDYSGCGE